MGNLGCRSGPRFIPRISADQRVQNTAHKFGRGGERRVDCQECDGSEGSIHFLLLESPPLTLLWRLAPELKVGKVTLG